VKKGLPALAIPQLESAVKLMSSDALAHYHLGIAYGDVGQKERARQMLQKALSLNPLFDGAEDARKRLLRPGL
jgi:Flp pilus assembly protein TadD